MNLIKYDNFWNDPFAEFDRILSRGFHNPRLNPLFESFGSVPVGGIRTDVYDDNDNYYVVAELPGIDKKDINVELENAVLTITANRHEKEGDKEQTFELRRSVTVGDDVAADKVKARIENGLLRVTLPKSEARKPKAISVS